MAENKKEMVNHPAHYQGKRFEVIDIIEDYDLGFCLGNAIKYILRAGKKGDKNEDLKKAIWYIEREIKSAPHIIQTKENSIDNLHDDEKSFTKCMSCGKIFIADNGDMICNECKEKYVDENVVKKSITADTSIPEITYNYAICEYCGKPYAQSVSNFDWVYDLCQQCFNKIERTGMDIEEYIIANNLALWHDFRYHKPKDGEYNCYVAKVDIMTKVCTYSYERLNIKDGQHLIKAYWFILSWQENKQSENILIDEDKLEEV